MYTYIIDKVSGGRFICIHVLWAKCPTSRFSVFRVPCFDHSSLGVEIKVRGVSYCHVGVSLSSLPPSVALSSLPLSGLLSVLYPYCVCFYYSLLLFLVFRDSSVSLTNTSHEIVLWSRFPQKSLVSTLFRHYYFRKTFFFYVGDSLSVSDRIGFSPFFFFLPTVLSSVNDRIRRQYRIKEKEAQREGVREEGMGSRPRNPGPTTQHYILGNNRRNVSPLEWSGGAEEGPSAPLPPSGPPSSSLKDSRVLTVSSEGSTGPPPCVPLDQTH